MSQYKDESEGEMNLVEEDWSYLIILDACRYDVFEAVSKYISGELKKVTSPASCTVNWIKRTFPGFYDDIIYISANPLINSHVKVRGYKASRHFQEVVDVWDWGWKDRIGTVPPKLMNREAKKVIRKYPDKRFVIHYLQPHYPYLHIKRNSGGKSYVNVFKVITSTLIRSPFWVAKWLLRELKNEKPSHLYEIVVRKWLSKEDLRLTYKENLKIVMERVTKLLEEELRGKIIITSDHGELLGEDGEYGHKLESDNPILTEVPYFEVEQE